MKIVYKSASFELVYEDNDVSGHRDWREESYKRSDVFVALTKADAEAQTRYQTVLTAAKTKELTSNSPLGGTT